MIDGNWLVAGLLSRIPFVVSLLAASTTESIAKEAVNSTGPISLSPDTRPPPPPPYEGGIIARAAYAGCGASQLTSVRAAKANGEEPGSKPTCGGGGQKSGRSSGGRITAAR